MKKDTHPQYFTQAKVSCACGNKFITGSTKPEIRVEICSNCHPFFTGAAKFVDTEGRVERFQRQQKEASTKKDVIHKKKQEQRPIKEGTQPQSLKEMMEVIQKQK